MLNDVDFPVDESEIIAFEKMTDVVQGIIFYRWQVRSFSKLLTGLLLLAAPFALQNTS